MLSNQTNRIVVGVVRWFTPNDKGGYWHVRAPEGKFRIYPTQFKNQPIVGQIISFVPDPRSSGKLRKVSAVLFEPDASPIINRRNFPPMNNYDQPNNKPPASNDMAILGFQRPRLCDDPYYAKGSDFPVPENTDKGVDSGPENLTGGESDKQRSPRLNASKPGEANSTWGTEGRQFPTDANGKESEDEKPVFAGDKDSTVGVSLVSGQILSTNETRLIPVPLSGEPKTIRANVKFKKAKGDIRENRI